MGQVTRTERRWMLEARVFEEFSGQLVDEGSWRSQDKASPGLGRRHHQNDTECDRKQNSWVDQAYHNPEGLWVKQRPWGFGCRQGSLMAGPPSKFGLVLVRGALYRTNGRPKMECREQRAIAGTSIFVTTEIQQSLFEASPCSLAALNLPGAASTL